MVHHFKSPGPYSSADGTNVKINQSKEKWSIRNIQGTGHGMEGLVYQPLYKVDVLQCSCLIQPVLDIGVSLRAESDSMPLICGASVRSFVLNGPNISPRSTQDLLPKSFS